MMMAIMVARNLYFDDEGMNDALVELVGHFGS